MVSIDTIMSIKRPTHKELTGKIRLAKKAVLDNNKIAILDPESAAADALELGYLIKNISKVLADILDEITPFDYAGQSPPQRSYETAILGSELFAFRWQSTLLGCETYFKFTIQDDIIWLVSLHRNR